MKKNLVMFTSVFASLAILSTGFAAWVVAGGEEKVETIGSVTIKTVTDNRHKITISKVDNGEIVFGRLKTQDTTSSWLTASDDDSIEKLSTVFKVVVTNAADKKIDDIFKTKTFVENETSLYDAAFKKGYVGEMPSVQFVDSESSITTADTLKADTTTSSSGVIYVRLQFSWGTHFSNENPYTYYNKHGVDDKISDAEDAISYGDDSLTALNELAALNGAQFKLTLATK